MSYDAKKIIKQHPCFTHADDFSLLCQPLGQLGICYFGHVRVYNDNRFACFSSSPEYLNRWLELDYYNFDAHMLTPASKEQYIIWDTLERRGISKHLYEDFMTTGFGHIFSIIQQDDSYKDTYFFATKLGCDAINGQYMQHVEQLKSFICYFQNKVNRNKSLMLGYDLKTKLDVESGGYLVETPPEFAKTSSIINNNEINRIYIPGKDAYLTRQEMNCLHWLSLGKTAKETASILSITPRTVKAHIANIKEKLGCHSQFQLGMIYEGVKGRFKS